MNGNKIKSSLFGIFALTIIAVFIYGFSKPYRIDLKSLYLDLPQPSQVKIVIFGDMMLDRSVRILIDRNGFDKFFSGIKDVVKDTDIAVANLEGPFTTFPSITTDFKNKELKFTFDPKLAQPLADLGFDVFGLANNHTMNFGREGFDMTKRYLQNSGIAYYGDPNNKEEISTVIVKEGIKIGFIGFHEFTYVNFDKVFAEITLLRPLVDVLIVSPHWGNEYETKPTEKMVKWAHDFIDSGADAVIGAHPHVIAEIEEYKGKKIFYSLGNFVFDQYFSEETMKGLGVVMEIEKSNGQIEINYKQIPIRVDREGVRAN